MADIQSNINLDIDASGAIATLRTLQRQISAFQQTMAKTGAMSNARLGDMQQNLVNSINSTGQFTASIQRVRTTTESFTNALEKNKLSMGQYFRYSMGATKTFGKGFRTEFDTIDKVARERVKTLQTQYIKLGRDASGAMQAIAVRPQVLDMQNLGTQTAIAAQKAQLFNQLMAQGSTNLLNFGKNTQWAGRQLMVGFTIPLGIMGAAAAKEFKAIEEQVIRLERVYGDFTTTMAETEQITSQIKDLANEFTKYGVSVTKTIGLAADAAAMGQVGADLVAQVAEANRLAVLGGVQQEQALETTISLTSAFGVAREELANKTDFLNAVENQTITSIEDLTTAIPKAGPVVQQLGGNVEDLTFFLTAMREGGINASESANALKSGLASLINPTAEASEMLGGFGINLQGIVEANKGNVKGIVIDFAKALDTLDPLNRAQAIEQLFGKFQFSRLSTLFQNVIKEGGQASRVLELTQSSAAELAALSERELGKVEASPLFQFEGAIERFKAALAPVGEEFMKAVTPLINFGTQILEGFNNMQGGVKQFSVIAVGAIGAIGPVLLMTIGLLMNGFANMVKGVLFVRNGFKGMGDQSNILTNQLNYMNSEQLESAAVSASLNQVHNTLIQTFTSEASAVRNLAAAYGQAIAVQGGFMGSPAAGGRGKKPRGFASGGIFKGPGSGTSDSILAMVSNGEAIIPAATVKKFPELINGLVSGTIPGFADGTPKITVADYRADMEGPRRRRGISQNIQTMSDAGFSKEGDRLLKMLKDANIPVAEARRVVSRAAQAAKQGGESMTKFFGDFESSLDTWKSSGSKNAKALVSTLDEVSGVAAQRAATRRGDFTHIGSGRKMSAKDYFEQFGNEGLSKSQQIQLQKQIAENKDVSIKSGLGMSDFDPTQNRKLAREGTTSAALAKAYNTAGIEKWNESVRLGGGDVKALSKDIKAFDKDLGNLIKGVDKGTLIFDSRAQAEEYMAKNVGKTATSLEELYSVARRNASPALQESLDKSHRTAREVRMGASRMKEKKYPESVSSALVSVAEEEISEGKKKNKATRQSTEVIKKQAVAVKFSAEEQERYNKQTASERAAMTRAKRKLMAGNDKLTALEQQAMFGPMPVGGMDDDPDKKPRMRDRLRNAMSPGKLGVAGMVAGGGLSAMSMMGGPVGDVAGQIGGPLMAISGVASVLSMIPGPAGIAVGAIAAVGAGLFALDQHARQMNESARKTVDALSSGKDAMDKFAAATGKISSVDIVAGQDLAESTGRQADLSNTSFGGQYVESEEGKAYIAELKSGLIKEGRGAIVGDIANQVATAMSAGILTGEEAQSLIDNMAVALKDSSLAVSVSGKLTELIGIDGKNLKDNPLEVSVKLIEATGEDLQGAIEQIDFSSVAPVWFFGATDDAMAERAYNEAKTAQAISDIVDQEKLALANAKLRNDEKVKELQAAGDLVGLAEQQKKYEGEKLAIEKASAEQLKIVQDKLNAQSRRVTTATKAGAVSSYSTDQATGGIIDKIEEERKSRFAEEPEDVKNMANKTIESFANTNQLQAGTKATLLATIDVENIEVFNDLKKFFPPDQASSEKVYNYIADVSTNLGAEAGSDVAQVISLFGDDEDKVANFIANFDLKNPEQLKTVLDAKEILEGIGEEFDINVFVNEEGEPTEELKRIQNAYSEIQAAVDSGGPIVLEQLSFIDQAGLQAMGVNQAWFDSLPAEQQKLFLQRYVTVFETVSDKDATAWYQKNKSATVRQMENTSIATIRSAYAANAAKEYATNFSTPVTSKQPGPPSGPSGPTGGGGGGAAKEPEKPPTSFLDSIVKDMREFTTATQGLTENFVDSMNAIRSSSASAFGGLSQQLRRVGIGEDVISLMTGMSKEEWDQYKGQFFNFDAAGNVTGFKSDLTAISDKLRTITLGKFVDEQQKSMSNTANQALGLSKLVSLGMSYANAYEMVEDAALAAAIANAKSADEIRRIIELANQARQAQSLADASKSIAGTNAATDATVAGLNALVKYNSALSDAQVSAILASDELQTMLANFDNLSVDQLKVLNEALQDAANKEALEIKIKMQTTEGIQELFNEGFGKAMEQFSAKEQEIKIKFTALKDPFQDVIKSFSQQIEDMKEAPGGLDDLEADLERIGEQEVDINKKYDERFKALDSIAKINDRIAAQQRTQLSLSEALSMGDIAAAARVAQEMRAQDAAQALIDQREALQKSQELELENLTGNMGLTREQIESRIRDIKRQIFEIEEAQIEPAQRQIDLLVRQEELEINSLTVLGKTREEWENIKNGIEVARTNTEKFNESINLALNVADDLLRKWQEIERPKETIHTIIENRVQQAEAEAARRAAEEEARRKAAADEAARQAALASTQAAPAGPVKDDAWVTSMARRVIRGEFGNGRARMNALGGDYQVIQNRVNRILYQGYAKGGMVASYLANGGFPGMPRIGTDTVPAMLTPGEFVVRKYAVDKFGADNLKAINNGSYSGGSVYNYNMSVNVRSDANPDEIARTVMTQIKRVDAQRIRGNRF